MARSDTLAPGFLVASPRLDGSLFERSVIVMVHHDEEGAMGFIINRPLEVDLGSLLEMVEMDEEILAPDCYQRDVYFGGPVRVEQLWIIYHAQDGEELGERTHSGMDDLHASAQTHFHERWGLSGSSDSIEAFADGTDEHAYRPFIGYAGWGPGQLEDEIGDGSWLMLDFDEDLVFDVPVEQMWTWALDRLGIDEMTFTLMGKGDIA